MKKDQNSLLGKFHIIDANDLKSLCNLSSSTLGPPINDVTDLGGQGFFDDSTYFLISL